MREKSDRLAQNTLKDAQAVSERTSVQPVLHNIPSPLTSFVGRTWEMAKIRCLLEQTRLLTLVGTAGTGKTRLALHIAHTLSTTFVDGIWLVELASLSDPGLLPLTLASALKIHEEADLPFITAISTALQAKKVLLVLDNCEHLVHACAHMIEILLQACPTLHILVTSREALSIGPETLFPVSPLAQPDPTMAPTVENALQSEAVRLFVERACLVQPHFQLTDHSISAVIQVCQQLDGIPLALELAAARLRLLPVEQLAIRLGSMQGECLHLLTSGRRTATPRHQTLQAAIDWSYYLLSSSEQLLLQRLSIFAGTWTLEAAEAICAVPPLQREEVQQILGELVNKSLVQMRSELMPTALLHPHPPLARQARYSFLETIRQYAYEKMHETGEEERIQHHHLTYFLTITLQAEKQLRGTEQLLWLNYLEQEYDNLRLALGYAVSLSASKDGIQLVSALSWFWALRGRFQEGLTWLDAMLKQRAGSQDVLQATALYHAGLLSWFQRDFQRLAAYSEESLTCFRLLDHQQGICRAQTNLVEFARWQGNHQKALALGEECLAILAKHADPWTQALLSIPLLTIYRMQENDAQALHLAETALSLFRTCGDRWGTATILSILGLIASRLGNTAQTDAYAQESLALFQALSDAHGIADALYASAMALLIQGDQEQALAVLEESRRHAQKSGDVKAVCQILLDQGCIAIQKEEYEQANSIFATCVDLSEAHTDLLRLGKAKYFLGKIAIQQHFFQKGWFLLQESLNIFFRLDHHLQFAACLETLAMMDMLPSVNLVCRVRWLGAAQALRTSLQVPLRSKDQAQYNSTITRLQAILGEAEYANALTQGRMLLPEQILSEMNSSRAIEQPVFSTTSLAPIDGLTPREGEVLRLVSTGLSNIQIATKLGISKGTVKTHLLAIYSKLGVKSRTAAVYVAHDHRLF